MTDRGPFVYAVVYLAVPLSLAVGLVVPPSTPRPVVLAVGAAVVVPLAVAMAAADGGRAGLALPDPLTYLLEVVATFGLASVLTAPLPRYPLLSTRVVVVTPRTAALLTCVTLALCWLFVLDGHPRVMRVIRRLQGRRRIS